MGCHLCESFCHGIEESARAYFLSFLFSIFVYAIRAFDGEAVIDDVLSSEIEKFESGGKSCQLSQAIRECRL
jgi:hypothetical protein